MKTINKQQSVTNIELDQEQQDRLTMIEDALLDSVSGGQLADDGICTGHQFCEMPPDRNNN
ncbi:hypothetical protein [Shewanella sp. NIFS-20-20]|uniref:hypothetical protein n=1 Tax=Shewanella sp. NIFS-20-20 TaxID=2853806 RepID=UPI001C449BA6|nr:hypothetical protein [Shewanella sp. NIFS-20-20]MBV7314953.1 hypothetical protein [Shewanella sp. NIFS-20-20]